MFASVRHEVFCGKFAGRSTDLLLLWFSKVTFLVANQLFSEGVINSETVLLVDAGILINIQKVQTRHQGLSSLIDQLCGQESVHRDVCFHVEGEEIPNEGARCTRALGISKYRASAAIPGMLKPPL